MSNNVYLDNNLVGSWSVSNERVSAVVYFEGNKQFHLFINDKLSVNATELPAYLERMITKEYEKRASAAAKLGAVRDNINSFK